MKKHVELSKQHGSQSKRSRAWFNKLMTRCMDPHKTSEASLGQYCKEVWKGEICQIF